jgi:predicted aspartyl protease
MRRLLLAASALLFAAPVSAEPLIFDNGRLFIQAKINGLATEALLDSAAEATVVDPKLAKEAQLGEGQEIDIRGSGGVAKARVVEGVSLEAIGLAIKPEAVVVTDLSELSSRLIKRPTNLVLGRELFDSARLQIDIGKGAIVQATKGKPPPGRMIKLTTHAGVESLAVIVNGRQAQAEFDLGNGSDVLISRAMAKRMNLKVTGKKAGGGIGGQLNRDLVVLKRLNVGGKLFRDVSAAIDDQPNANDLNIGTSILKNFLITTDFKSHSIWLQPAGKSGR